MIDYSNWKKKNKYYKKKFSILGDSISTLEGHNPSGYKLFYFGANCDKAKVHDGKDTWWGKVIDFFCAELLVNNSWSGSRVTMMPKGRVDNLFPAGISEERTAGLHIGNVKPDVIIVNLGVNDWANGVTIDCDKDGCTLYEYYTSFAGAYEDMLQKLKRNYPQSEIWCCTLCETFMATKPSFKFPHAYAGVPLEEYNEVIRRTAQEQECKLIDLSHYHVPYDSLDGTHPTAEGMNTIAAMVIRAIGGTEVEKYMDCENNQYEHAAASDEYVLLDPEKTAILYDENIKLTIGSTGKTVQIRKAEFSAGRDPSCDLQFDNSHMTIARRQATFFLERGMWLLRDNNSKNGTWLNGAKMIPGKKYQLAANDVIDFAHSETLVFYKTKTPIRPPVGNEDAKTIAILEAAISAFTKSEFKDDASLKLIIASLVKAPLYFPVETDLAAMFGHVDPMKLKAGDIIQQQKDVKLRVLTLKTDGGTEIVPMFTSSEKAKKNQIVSTIRQYPQDYLPILLKMNKTVIINPFEDARFIMPQAFITGVLKPFVLGTISGGGKNATAGNTNQTTDDTDDLIGKVVDGKFEILKLISQGGTTSVYLAADKRLNQTWAIKVCDKSIRGYHPAIRDVFLRETSMLMKLYHPVIPRVIDLIENERYIYIIKEYVQGETFDQILRHHGAQPEEQVIEWAKQLCDVLKYLHGLNPPHIYRDMKPANILLQSDGRIKLIDFGTMRLYDPKKDRDTIQLGTKGYAAPEQFGGAGQTDARTDIFGLGMTMHHMVTGVNPNDPPYIAEPIRKINPKLSPKLEYIIQKCIEPDCNKRFQNCDELMKALDSEHPEKQKGFIAKLFGMK